MDTPINDMLNRAANRKVASRKAKGKNELSLRDQVLELVKASNASVNEERRVTPRAALIVMDRALQDLSALPRASREYGARREVTKFLSIATSTVVASAKTTKHTDLLPAGHPQSDKNYDLDFSEFCVAHGAWLASDSNIPDSARPLIASAHSAMPGSIERTHAFMRLNNSGVSIPSYFKIDELSAITAAFRDGNSSAARRARVALQWRDRMGRWVEMGRGVNFRFRMPDGSIVTGRGIYVGAGGDSVIERTSTGTALTTNTGLVYISGNSKIPAGLYKIDSGNAVVYQARIPGMRAPEQGTFEGQFDTDIPSLKEVLAGRQEAPIGWKRQGAYYVSDDNYAVIPAPNGEPRFVTRLTSDGRPGASVGEVRGWDQVNELINKDQPEFDKEIARIEAKETEGQLPLGRVPGADEADIVNPADLIEMQRQRAEENRALDKAAPQPKELPANEDLFGKPVPEGWTRDADDSTDMNYTREMPLRDGGTFPIIAHQQSDGTYIAGSRSGWIPAPGTDGRGPVRYFESLEEVNREGVPGLVEYLNSTFTKDNPIMGDFVLPADSKLDAQEQAMMRQGITLDFADPEQAAEDSGISPDASFEEIVDAWFEKFIKPAAPSAKLEKTVENNGQMPSISISADNEKDLLNAFRAYFGDDEATQEDLEDHSEPFVLPADSKLDAAETEAFKRGSSSELDSPDVRDEVSILVPADSVTIARDRDDQAVIVRMPDGSWVEYDNEENVTPLSNAERREFIRDIKNEENTRWRDENGEMFFEEALKDNGAGAGTPPSGPTTPSGEYGTDFTDMVIDGAESQFFMDRELEQMLDNDAKEAGIEFTDQLWQAADDRFDLQDQFDQDRLDGLSKEEFIEAAMNKFDANLDATIESAFDARRDAEDDESLEIDFDKEAFSESAREYYRELLESLFEDDEDNGPDEPPTPPSGPSGGTPPKTPSPSNPEAPGLFENYDVPKGAFQLRTTEYEPEGRVDEESTDFTDDPARLATRFTPQDLVRAMSQALLGNSDDASVNDILNANVDDNNDIVDPADLPDNVDIASVNVGSPSGAGQLEFNAGAEYVQAEALYNALYEAGLDPNRVIANIYDSANGNNNNLNKLIEAQGGVPSEEEAQLVDDITAEIRQIKDAAPDEDSVSFKKNVVSEDPLPGELIENVPQDFNNPDYYIVDSNAYVPSQPELDEEGYTDNPELLARYFETADLTDQFLSGITDGSGVGMFDFSDGETYMEGIHEVPVEAIRDALQFQGINTNAILFDLNKESNDMSEDKTPDTAPESAPASERPRVQAHTQMIKDLIEQGGGNVDDETADKIRDAIDQEGLLDWSEADDAEIIDAIAEVAGPDILRQAPTPAAERRFPPTTGERQAIETPTAAPQEEVPTPVTPETPFGDNEVLNSLTDEVARLFANGFGPDNKVVGVYEGNDYNRSMIAVANDGGDDNQVILFTASRDGIMTNYSAAGPDWFTGPGSEMGWRQLSPEESSAITERIGTYNPEEPVVQPEPAPEPTPRAENPDVRPAPSAPAGPVYPGPENRGYHRDNTVLDPTGKVMGYGTRVRASRDGRTGTVIAVQNIDNASGERIPYVRIRFDDGTIAVRSALKVRSMDGTGQVAPVDAGDRGRVNPPMPNLQDRLDAPNPTPGLQASEGNITGVKLVDTPEDITPYVNPDLTQAQFEAWGLRAGEIARAGRERAKLDAIAELARLQQIDVNGFRALPDGPEKDAKKKEIDDRKKLINQLLSDAFGARDGVRFGANDFYLTSSMSSTTVYGDEAALQNGTASIVLSQNMNIHDKDGRVIGDVRRSMTRKTDANGVPYWEVKNEYMVISGGQKKNGFATAYNRYMEDWYIANGVKEIHVMAAGGGQYQGAFVWALNGFNWETGDYASNVVPRRIRDLRAMATTDGEKAALDRIEKKFNDSKNPDGTINLDTVPTPIELALVGWYPGAKDWIGKKYMTQNGWHGVKRLDPTKREQVQAINYDQQRRAEKRVAAKENKPNVSREFALTANSNEFETNNPALQPYMTEIRDVLQNNRSLAALSPAAKTALSRYVSEQILKGEDRQLSLADAFQLRTALDAEAYADNPRMSAKDFGAGEVLAASDFQAIITNQVPGFSARELGHDESGYNSTYLVTHLASGQVFYVKQDDLARDYGIDAAQAEVEAGILLRALNMQGTYETRINPSTDNAIIMQQAGSNMSLGSAPEVAYKVFRDRGIVRKDGSTLSFREDDLAENLHSPEDIVRMALLDLIINNEDRHNGNVLLAVDGRDPSRVRVLPIDHSLAQLNPDGVDEFRLVDIMERDGNNIYSATMPVLTKRMKEDELLAMFRNEANRMRAALKDDSILPTGKELEKLIRRWGSLENYRAAINARLDALLTPGGSEHGEFQQILNKRYWN